MLTIWITPSSTEKTDKPYRRSRDKDVEKIWPSANEQLRELRYAPESITLGVTQYVYDDKVSQRHDRLMECAAGSFRGLRSVLANAEQLFAQCGLSANMDCGDIALAPMSVQECA